ncbi:MAG TPA: HypC/HybG/HupF family hydrogenase formation chaperone [Anaerolineaceae bacterium]|jgi:hydrogenase expression/formation protein HypC|nr:HypC/HybG/HupF family hydrogenase formation chaperone [Anaerolineales bacterium]HOG57947.1 HypC/HybG/HupF family hydrogenase formation chaperone [Anaerolineaceae bacterium]HOR83792.1 HypC/HybG/HupF family hydrogenase formation chaperone [Anaerolineaceae bacterium]HPL42684.1 HypC/HybG/HupF family hydrogenase formation chaperone [Anaerolineaceae bacterium]HPY32792.1 HypC/HybG/HupF family hydrogenase formation chaperone [Anaerolineaceae bacterium]
MCLGIPGKIIRLYDLDGTAMANVDFGGVQQEVCVAAVPGVQLGQYVIVHAGFALNMLSEEEAQETMRLLKEIAEFNQAEEKGESAI